MQFLEVIFEKMYFLAELHRWHILKLYVSPVKFACLLKKKGMTTIAGATMVMPCKYRIFAYSFCIDAKEKQV